MDQWLYSISDHCLPVTDEEITTAIASINKRKSADFHNLTIEHILHAGENIITVWLYSISDHCFDDLTNYRQNCYSPIVDGIVFASFVFEYWR
jgi:hypothetical protein